MAVVSKIDMEMRQRKKKRTIVIAAVLIGLAGGGAALFCLYKSMGNLLAGKYTSAVLFMLGNLAAIGACLLPMALIAPHFLGWTGGAFAAALLLGGFGYFLYQHGRGARGLPKEHGPPYGDDRDERSK